MDKKQIGLRIKSLRVERGLFQKNLVKMLDIETFSRSNLSRLENGGLAPAAEVLIKLSRIFQVTTDWILTGEGAADYAQDEYSRDIKELLEDFNRDVKLKHAVLGFYYSYKLDKKKSLKQSEK